MDKYYEAIRAIASEADRLAAYGLDLLTIYKDQSNKLYGVREVAIYDPFVTGDKFNDLVDETQKYIDMWRERAFA
jgi:hypothetical protein